MQSPVINTKKELFEYFQIKIHKAYNQVLENKKFDFENSFLKTHLVENDIPKNEDVNFYFKNNFSFKQGTEVISPDIKKTNDDELFHLHYKNLFDLYIDISNGRIWNLYTLGKSDLIQKLINRITLSPYFDNIWLYHEFLTNFQSQGIQRGLGLDFDYRKFENDEEKSPVFKMQLSGGNWSQKVLDALYNIEGLKEHITLSKIKLKTFNPSDSSLFVLEDIKYNGKISVRGSDINQHLITLLSIRKSYLGILEKIEKNYRFGWKNNNGSLSLEGFPVYFVKEGSEMDLELICTKMFNGSHPFKLLGNPIDIQGGKYIQVYDIHIGGVFNLQLYPDMFILYLNENVCGNTILRFFTNLQHSFSNSFKMLNDNEETIL